MNTLLVLVGPTGVGKTTWSIRIAEKLNCPILSADSRQLYKGMSIGTAAPMPDQLSRAKHYFIGILSPEEYYSASRYEEEAITLIQGLHKKHSVVIMTGGSMLYIDAVCRGKISARSGHSSFIQNKYMITGDLVLFAYTGNAGKVRPYIIEHFLGFYRDNKVR